MNKEDDNIFVKSLRNVKPIKKNNKIIRQIPKEKPTQKKIFVKKPIETTPTKPEKIKTKIYESHRADSNIRKKLKKGKIPIDKKIDFHGQTLEEAKTLFINTINYCFLKNYRCLLFITGKGINKKTKTDTEKNKLYYGKIRSNFIDWTNLNEVKIKILNVEQADISHGGDGAFFIYLRKNKF